MCASESLHHAPPLSYLRCAPLLRSFELLRASCMRSLRTSPFFLSLSRAIPCGSVLSLEGPMRKPYCLSHVSSENGAAVFKTSSWAMLAMYVAGDAVPAWLSGPLALFFTLGRHKRPRTRDFPPSRPGAPFVRYHLAHGGEVCTLLRQRQCHVGLCLLVLIDITVIPHGDMPPSREAGRTHLFTTWGTC